jgi:hypothetical protein
MLKIFILLTILNGLYLYPSLLTKSKKLDLFPQGQYQETAGLKV